MLYCCNHNKIDHIPIVSIKVYVSMIELTTWRQSSCLTGVLFRTSNSGKHDQTCPEEMTWPNTWHWPCPRSWLLQHPVLSVLVSRRWKGENLGKKNVDFGTFANTNFMFVGVWYRRNGFYDWHRLFHLTYQGPRYRRVSFSFLSHTCVRSKGTCGCSNNTSDKMWNVGHKESFHQKHTCEGWKEKLLFLNAHRLQK